jgi:hypothetical protein
VKRVLVIAAVSSLLLVGCGSDNTDPRNGVVTIDESGCFWGDCYSLTKFCVGPDLHTVYDEVGDDDFDRTDENSPECEAAS